MNELGEIGEIKTKTGISYGILTINDIDFHADDDMLFTMYSEIMHDVKRVGYAEAYTIWTEEYERLVAEAGFKESDYCLRAGEAVRYYCAMQANMPFVEKYALRGGEKWVISCLYIEDGKLYTELLGDLQADISNLEDCFARYKIAFTAIDEAV